MLIDDLVGAAEGLPFVWCQSHRKLVDKDQSNMLLQVFWKLLVLFPWNTVQQRETWVSLKCLFGIVQGANCEDPTANPSATPEDLPKDTSRDPSEDTHEGPPGEIPADTLGWGLEYCLVIFGGLC